MSLSLVEVKHGLSYGNVSVHSKRSATLSLEERKKECGILTKAKKSQELVNDLLGDIPDIPVIGTASKVIISGFKMLGHLFGFGMSWRADDLACDAIPFDEIKNILNKRFNEVDRKLDKLTMVLEEVSVKVSITLKTIDEMRTEMHEGFKMILNTIESQEIKFIVNKIDTFVRFFQNERERILSLPQREYVFKLQEKNGILEFLKDSRTPKDDSLHSALFELIDRNNNFAIPDDAEDTKAFMALYALHYGTQAYCSVMFFLLEQYSYLADYYYQNGNAEKFNKNFDLLKSTYDDFSFSLVGNKNTDALIDKVIEITDLVSRKDFIKNIKNEFYSKISKGTLLDLKDKTENMELDMLVDVPDPVRSISFKNSAISTPFGEWISDDSVEYAVQLMNEGKYSRISDWKSFPIKENANPTLTIPVDEKRKRLVFRRFNFQKPEFVGIMNSSQVEFTDIDRDLYDASQSIYKQQGFEDAVKLLNAGANVNAVFEYGRTVLHAAAESGNQEVADLYLKRGIDVNIADSKGYTALHVAAFARQSDFAQFLLNNGADVNAHTLTDLLTPSHIASESGFLDTLKILMSDKHFKVDEKESFGFTPLHYALQGGTAIVNELLLRKDIDINSRSKTGLTPFHMAILKDDQEMADILYKTGKVYINDGDDNSTTALHFAAMAGNLKMVKYLLSLKEIHINPEEGSTRWTPLNYAIYLKKEDVAQQLLKDPRIEVNKIAYGNITPLHLAVASGLLIIVYRILQKFPNMEIKTGSDGYTPLHLSVSLSNIEVTSMLLDVKANVNTKDNHKSTPLHLATASGTIDMLTKLLKYGADVRAEDGEGRIPVEIAVNNYDGAKFEVFTNYGLNLTDLNADHDYLTRVYISFNHLLSKDLYDFLVANRKFIGNKFYYDVYDIFEQKGKLEVLKVLRKKWGDHKDYFYRHQDAILFCVDNVPARFSKEECFSLFGVSIPISKRSTTSEKKQFIPESSEFNSIPFNLESVYKTKNQDFNWALKHLESSDSLGFHLKEPFDNMQSINYRKLHPFDENGTLMLLDMLVRKFTNEKHKPFSSAIHSDLEIRAKALNLTEKLRKVAKKVSCDDKIDFAALHSQVYKAIKSGKVDIFEALKSFLKNFLSASEINVIFKKITNN